MVKRLRARHEDGYVLALFAVSLVGLILLIGVAVDLGTWYLRASKIQRAADVAAISGASALPSTSGARDRATESLQMNGFASSSRIGVTIDVSEQSVNVRIDDRAVPTYFLKPLMNSIDMQRKSNAVKTSAIPLGNPFNIFGYGSANGMGVSGGSPQGFWAAVNAYCTPKEDGDYFSAAFDANKGSGRHVCNNPALRNPDYIRSDSGAPGDANGYAGYNYMVDVPAGAGPVDLLVFDGQYSSSTGAADKVTKLGADTEAGLDTSFNVYRVGDNGNETLISSQFFRDGDANQGINGTSGYGIWYRLAQSVGAGEYRINVTSRVPQRIFQSSPGNLQSTGWNTFSLMASRQSQPLRMCDSRTNANTCPRISGKQAVSVYTERSGGTADFYLAEIDPGYAGSELKAFLWDPGEGTQSIELISPSGRVVPFELTVAPDNGETGTTISTLNVSGTAPPTKPGITGNGKYNDRLITLAFRPQATDYDGATDSWWKLRYRAGGGTVTDRTTWGVNVGDDSPVYLAAPQ